MMIYKHSQNYFNHGIFKIFPIEYWLNPKKKKKPQNFNAYITFPLCLSPITRWIIINWIGVSVHTGRKVQNYIGTGLSWSEDP